MPPAAGCRSAPSWRWPFTSPASATTPAAGSSSAACPRAAATSSPRPSCRRCSAGRWPARWRRRSLRRGSDEVWEFGAGSGALAAELLAALGPRIRRYSIVELSAPLRERQRAATREFAGVVRWLDALPERMNGVVIGNEVLDAMPVDLLHFDGADWFERGVGRGDGRACARLQRPADGAAAAERCGAAGRHDDRDPCPGRSLRRHPGRAHGAGRGLLRRLRLSGERVLPPAARRRAP